MGVGVTDLHGVGPVMARRLDAVGLRSIDDIATASIERLMEVPGVGQHVAVQLQAQARELAAGSSVDQDESRA
jgi:predicted RecB family nuclease